MPRISDLAALVSSTQGKIEIEALEEGREERILQGLMSAAVLSVFRRRCPTEQLGRRGGRVRRARWSTPATTCRRPRTGRSSARCPRCEGPVLALAGGETPGAVASATEFVLEGLHLTKRLNKEAAGSKATYRGRWMTGAVDRRSGGVAP